MTLRRPLIVGLGFQGLRSLRHRNYRLFFVGQLISVAGTWMQAVGQAWLILQLTGDPFLLGVVAVAQYGPVLVFGLFGGIISDVLPKRTTLIATNLASMVLAIVLFALAATGRAEVWQVILLAALLGVTNAVEMPVRQAFAVEMVEREDIANAVALNSAIFNAARIVGPALAGLTIGSLGVAAVFLLNAVSYLAVVGALALMRPAELRPAPTIDRPRTAHQVGSVLADGLRYVRRTDIVLLAIVALGLTATFGINFQIVIPPLARDVLGTDAAGFGFLMAASGIGSLAAALTIASVGTRPIVIAVGGLVLGVAEIVLGLSRNFALSAVALFFAGGGAIALAATVNTTIQLTVPDQLRGRVMSTYTTVFAGSAPVGGLLMGAIASAAGVDVAIWLGGAISIVVAIGVAAWLRRIDRVVATPATPAEALPVASLDRAAAAGLGVARASSAAKR